MYVQLMKVDNVLSKTLVSKSETDKLKTNTCMAQSGPDRLWYAQFWREDYALNDYCTKAQYDGAREEYCMSIFVVVHPR